MAGVAAWCFIVALVGTSIGLILGTVRLPILLLVSSSPAAGAGANVGISTVAAATAAATHVRRRTVNWKFVAWMTPPSIVGALIGGYVSGRLDESTLLVVIGLVLVYFGLRTFIGSGAERGLGPERREDASRRRLGPRDRPTRRPRRTDLEHSSTPCAHQTRWRSATPRSRDEPGRRLLARPSSGHGTSRRRRRLEPDAHRQRSLHPRRDHRIEDHGKTLRATAAERHRCRPPLAGSVTVARGAF